MWVLNVVKKCSNLKRVTFEKLILEWLEFKKSNVKKSTYANYEYTVKKYLLCKFRKFNLKDLERYNFKSFVKELEDEYSSKTANDIIIKLRSILTFANDNYKVNINTNKISIPKPGCKITSILTKKEIIKLEKLCQNEIDFKNLGILIALNTGLRIGEVCALKWKDIDLLRREIKITKTMQRIYDIDNNITKVLIDKPKTVNSTRNIPISNKLYFNLLKYKKLYNENDFLLTGNSFKSLDPNSFRTSYKKILEKVNISKSYKFHALRHTFATNCISVGMDPKTLSEILGHSNVKITLDKYVHSSYNRKRKYLNKL